MIRPTFKQADILKDIEKRVARIEEMILKRLRILAEELVIMAKSNTDNYASAFPISYGSGGNNQPLKQRKITAADKRRNPAVSEPEFGDFLDYTGNLRASIGYAIIRDGKVIDSKYGSKETSTSSSIANERAKNLRKGYGIVIVAGMDYAAFVESKGYDVISSSEVFAKSEIPKIIAKMKKAINK